MFSIVTCYYNIKNKYCRNSDCTEFNCNCKSSYNLWINNFLKYTTYNTPVIVFTSKKDYEFLKKYETDKCIFYIMEFEDFEFYKYKQNLDNQLLNLDRERHIHNTNLYLVWNQKIFFCKYAVEKNPFNSEWFIWLDIGSSRNSRLNSLLVQKFNLSALGAFVNKIHFLRLGDITDFKNMDQNNISIINKSPHTRISLVGGLWFGDKNAIINFATEYNKLFDLYISHNIFAGKDQNLYANLVWAKPELFHIMNVDTQNWINKYQPDHWFYFYNYFMEKNQTKTIYISYLMGGLGNRLFEVASTYGISRKMNGIMGLSPSRQLGNLHSKINYYETVFKNFLIVNQQHHLQINERNTFKEDNNMYAIHSEEQKIIMTHGYLQVTDYFHKYRNELLHLIDLPPPSISGENTVFLHIRLGDYINSSLHFVNLEKYYKRCIDFMIQKYNSDIHFKIFSTEPNVSQALIKQFDLKNSSIYSNTDELQTLSDMSNCKLGGICANSTFSWWGAYLNKNTNGIFTLPTRWFGKDQNHYSPETPPSLIWEQTILINCD